MKKIENFETNPPLSDEEKLDHSLSSYDYELPPEKIAQTPVTPRDSSRLLVVESSTTHQHSVFSELPNWLKSGDLLVLNNTSVIPARLYGHKSTGAPVEVLLVEELEFLYWLALVKPGKRLKEGAEIVFDLPSGKTSEFGEFRATVMGIDEATGGRFLRFHLPENARFETLLDLYGNVPLPPYITGSESKPSQYQTVYAEQAGAIAAPTAGLHFTEELLERLQQAGIGLAYVTLHVGVGTFRPVEVEDIKSHVMHSEWIDVPPETVAKIQQAKAAGGRVIAVGTTAVRSLETAGQGEEIRPFRDKSDLFIYPGYNWRVVDGLITNFHLPKSSLLMLVSALIGRKRLLALYENAIAENYRFYSFGDAMLILPEAVLGR
ncbi:MAG: tRNA preQ1(34) S-adenosylmethionine ribosyltransferase-isomerase QueA [Chroococcales cyanobacterium]